ncbi:carbohydrate ABC transporter permease [Demequina maris]|uniref:carbohydrate ABC transporter permease n=1 Tax=Demequina maris TaxID=1638982 RepID=UPI0007814FA6|nr:carbohydrate ABC transporter permease [Demequina maris]
MTAPTNTDIVDSVAAPDAAGGGRSRLRLRKSSADRPGLLSNIGLGVVIALFMAPLLITVFTSLRTPTEVALDPLGLPIPATFDNFVEAFKQMDYLVSVRNTAVIMLASVSITVVFGALAAYPLARLTRRWTPWLYRSFILGMTLPIFVIIGPLYLLQRDLGLLNTWAGVILTYVGINLPVAIFFYTSFLRQVPIEVEEAAELDGAGPFRTFRVVVFPLLQPITATLGIFIALGVWNDLVLPLVFLRDPGLRTVMVNAYSNINPNAVDPTTLFPAAILGVLPLVLVFALMQRRVVQGLTLGSVK